MIEPLILEFLPRCACFLVGENRKPVDQALLKCFQNQRPPQALPEVQDFWPFLRNYQEVEPVSIRRTLYPVFFCLFLFSWF